MDFDKMPVENITRSQKHGKLFGCKLSEELDRGNKLYQLRELINWSDLEIKLSTKIKISKWPICIEQSSKAKIQTRAGYNI